MTPPSGGIVKASIATGAIIRTPIPTEPLYFLKNQNMSKISSHLPTMGSLPNKTRVILDSLGDIHGFGATILAGKPLLFYCTNGNQPQGKRRDTLGWRRSTENHRPPPRQIKNT